MLDLEKVLHDYKMKGINLSKIREIKSGKEATVFMAYYKDKMVALKVFKNPHTRAFQENRAYLAGKFYRSKKEGAAIEKRNHEGVNMMQKGWIRREYFLLKKLFDKKVTVPAVHEWTENSILMDFVGNDEGAAPRLIDVELTEAEAKGAFKQLITAVQAFLKMGIVHADLSAFNILWWEGKPIIIDLPQAIDIRSNPNKDKLLKRDLDNLMNYFERYFNIDRGKIYKKLSISFVADEKKSSN